MQQRTSCSWGPSGGRRACPAPHGSTPIPHAMLLGSDAASSAQARRPPESKSSSDSCWCCVLCTRSVKVSCGVRGMGVAHGTAWHGMAWHGMAWHGMRHASCGHWHSMARRAAAAAASARITPPHLPVWVQCEAANRGLHLWGNGSTRLNMTPTVQHVLRMHGRWADRTECACIPAAQPIAQTAQTHLARLSRPQSHIRVGLHGSVAAGCSPLSFHASSSNTGGGQALLAQYSAAQRSAAQRSTAEVHLAKQVHARHAGCLHHCHFQQPLRLLKGGASCCAGDQAVRKTLWKREGSGGERWGRGPGASC